MFSNISGRQGKKDFSFSYAPDQQGKEYWAIFAVGMFQMGQGSAACTKSTAPFPSRPQKQTRKGDIQNFVLK